MRKASSMSRTLVLMIRWSSSASVLIRPQPPAYRLLDHLIRPPQQRRRDRQTEGLGGREVDDQLESRWLPDWQVTRPGSSQNPIDVPRGRAVPIVQHGPVDEKTVLVPSKLTHRGEVAAQGSLGDRAAVRINEGTCPHEESLITRPGDLVEDRGQLLRLPKQSVPYADVEQASSLVHGLTIDWAEGEAGSARASTQHHHPREDR